MCECDSVSGHTSIYIFVAKSQLDRALRGVYRCGPAVSIRAAAGRPALTTGGRRWPAASRARVDRPAAPRMAPGASQLRSRLHRWAIHGPEAAGRPGCYALWIFARA